MVAVGSVIDNSASITNRLTFVALTLHAFRHNFLRGFPCNETNFVASPSSIA